MSRQLVGTIAALTRFPVKSMRGEMLPETAVYWHGLEGDRRYAFVQSRNRSDFPWLTARQLPQLVRYAPAFADPEQPRDSAVIVTTPHGRTHTVTSDELRAELAAAFGDAVHLMRIGRGAFDSQVLSLMSLASIRALGSAAGLALDPARLRQNILIDTGTAPIGGDVPFVEETWQDRQVAIGSGPQPVRLRLNRRIPRCVMVNIDPHTAVADPRVLKTIVQQRDGCAGMHASPEAVGTICVGDPVYLLPAA